MNARDFFYGHNELVVYDTEFTTWEGALERGWSGDDEHREIVQIAAQHIDFTNERVVSSFERIVRPRVNPTLSDYFVDLTGITQERVDTEGVDFVEMYDAFTAWAGEYTKGAYARRAHEAADRAVLEENVELYDLPTVVPQHEYVTLTGLFQAVGIDTNAYTSGELYRAFGLELDGPVHNAMHDVDSLVASLFVTRRILLGSQSDT